jgi:tRNA threonylcarbamoyladenosine biosynthesis protein TsaE
VLARTTSVDDTRALAAALAEQLRPGDVLLLSGEMGAGKTAFTQGLGAGLGYEGRITSPTFTIAHTYDGGRLRVHHLDVYRLEHLHEALDAGLAEMVDEGAVVVVEWGDAVLPLLPADHLDVRITFAPLDDDTAAGSDGGTTSPGDDATGDRSRDDERRWELSPVGEQWAARLPALRAALARWEVQPC